MLTGFAICFIYFYLSTWWKLRRRLSRFMKAQEHMGLIEFIIFLVMNFILLQLFGFIGSHLFMLNVFKDSYTDNMDYYCLLIGLTIALLRIIHHIIRYKKVPITNNINNSSVVESVEVDLTDKKKNS